MKTHVRLAERQGLLQQRHLSTVQAYALIILNHLDEIDRAHGDTRLLKHSLIASGADYTVLFPEYAQKPKEVIQDESSEAAENDAEAVWDYRNVEWKSPSDDFAAFTELMSKIGGKNTMSGEEVIEQPAQEIEWTDWR